MASLAIGDLNDFLAPSQICIKPVQVDDQPAEPIAGSAATQIKIDGVGQYFEIDLAKSKKLEKAQITLNDCLACSGCITSAESVLVAQQSYQQVYDHLSQHPDCLPIASISPQSIASLAAAYDIPSKDCFNQIRRFLKQKLGFKAVFDTTFARHLALQEVFREWAERCPGPSKPRQDLPVLASACPGWVCYAEKTQHDLLPLMSKVKSPQAVAGVLIKDWLSYAVDLGLGKDMTLPDRRNKIFHLSIMPCFDKKLEASRPDFADQDETRDVDCVLTTSELLQMMQLESFDVLDFQHCDIGLDKALPSSIQHSGTTSGSTLHQLLANIINTVPADLRSSLRMHQKQIRQKDYTEYILTSASQSGERIIFKGAVCNGFRNLQNLVRKLNTKNRGPVTLRAVARKRKLANGASENSDIGSDAPYDFVEVMACPSGCINGGGQVSSRDTLSLSQATDAFDRIQRAEDSYWSYADNSYGQECASTGLDASILPYLQADQTELAAQADVILGQLQSLHNRTAVDLLRTQYRAVSSEEINGLGVKW